MKQNICIIGLGNSYTAKISKGVADAFEMFFADVTELIKFELMDVEYARVVCGDEYIHKVERSKVKMVSTFENTLFTMDYSLLNDEGSLKVTKDNAYVIYLKLSKDNLKKVIKEEDSRVSGESLIYDVYEFRNQLCEKYADIIIDCNELSQKEIVKTIADKFMGK